MVIKNRNIQMVSLDIRVILKIYNHDFSKIKKSNNQP
jgi:hypothetical protein